MPYSQLPLFYQEPIVETKLSLTGTIDHVFHQPPKAYTELGQEVVLVVVAHVEKTEQQRSDAGVVWKNTLKVSEAYELRDDFSELTLKACREEVGDAISRTGRGDEESATG